MIDGLAMGCMHGVTTGCHTSCYNMHQAPNGKKMVVTPIVTTVS